MKTILRSAFFLLMLLQIPSVKSQVPPSIEWQQSYGGVTNEHGGQMALQQTTDAGYIIGGGSASDSFGASDYWVVKVDSVGNEVWNRRLGGSEIELFGCLQQLRDGGYILGGGSQSPISGNKTTPRLGYTDAWIIKLDQAGNKLWEKAFGGWTAYARDVREVDDGICVFVGYKNNVQAENWVNGWMMKINGGDGSLIWEKSYNLSASSHLESVDKTVDGYIAAGYYDLKDFWLIQCDTNGNRVWETFFRGNSEDRGTCVRQAKDGGYIVGGYSNSAVGGDKSSPHFGGYDYWIIKTDKDGDKVWEKSFGGSSNDILHHLEPTEDGGYILSGWSSSGISGNKSAPHYGGDDFWIIKIDCCGNKLWETSAGGFGADLPFGLSQSMDKGIIMGGHSSSLPSGNKTSSNYGGTDFWMVKLAAPSTPAPILFSQKANELSVVSWNSISNASYQVQHKNSLDAPCWTSLTNIPGNGNTAWFTNNASDLNHFYRVVATP